MTAGTVLLRGWQGHQEMPIDTAVRVFGRKHNCTYQAVNGLAKVYEAMGLPDEAIDSIWRYAESEPFQALLSLLRIQGSKVDPAEYESLLRETRKKFKDFSREIGALFPVAEGRVRPFHQSVTDWLTDPARAAGSALSVPNS